ncbi:MAG: hypothetical protein BroJett003_22570 [Planctomycetota bacterium]|nr:MAG: hypothetical protein BroJett003_22570 [Planctomycetota bacterium]
MLGGIEKILSLLRALHDALADAGSIAELEKDQFPAGAVLHHPPGQGHNGPDVARQIADFSAFTHAAEDRRAGAGLQECPDRPRAALFGAASVRYNDGHVLAGNG